MVLAVTSSVDGETPPPPRGEGQLAAPPVGPPRPPRALSLPSRAAAGGGHFRARCFPFAGDANEGQEDEEEEQEETELGGRSDGDDGGGGGGNLDGRNCFPERPPSSSRPPSSCCLTRGGLSPSRDTSLVSVGGAASVDHVAGSAADSCRQRRAQAR